MYFLNQTLSHDLHRQPQQHQHCPPSNLDFTAYYVFLSAQSPNCQHSPKSYIITQLQSPNQPSGQKSTMTSTEYSGLYYMNGVASCHFVPFQLLYRTLSGPCPSVSLYTLPLEAEGAAPICTTAEQAVSSSYSYCSPTLRPTGQLNNRVYYLNKI